ncbi:hypothetical protein FB451DRAFT_1233297 [Mycena latifolia]|nr:hypothetical protein FB451DRAFT_1233297 [Mycena latifolia]
MRRPWEISQTTACETGPLSADPITSQGWSRQVTTILTRYTFITIRCVNSLFEEWVHSNGRLIEIFLYTHWALAEQLDCRRLRCPVLVQRKVASIGFQMFIQASTKPQVHCLERLPCCASCSFSFASIGQEFPKPEKKAQMNETSEEPGLIECPVPFGDKSAHHTQELVAFGRVLELSFASQTSIDSIRVRDGNIWPQEIFVRA